MSLLRFAGRVLFSSYFVADGYKLLTKPDEHVDQFAATIDRVVPSLQAVLPPDAADRVPEDTRTWTRVLGIAQIVGGIAYAIGLGRRPAACLLTTSVVPRVVAASQNRDDRAGLLTQLALLGAGVVATQDTAGRPSMAWRAKQSRRALESHTASSGKAIGKGAKQATKSATRNLKQARKQLVKAGQQAEQGAAKAARNAGAKVKDVLH